MVRSHTPIDLAIYPGRWNREGFKVVYCAPTRTMAVLETAAHIDTSGFPLNRFLVSIDVPKDIWDGRTIVQSGMLDPEWSAIPAGFASADLGTRWLRGGTTVLCEVPSVIVHEESVVLLNPAHRGARRITAKVVRKFEYDLLFRR